MSAGYRGSPWQRRSQCSCLRCVRHQFEVAAVGAFFRDVYCSFFGNSKSDSLSMRLGLSRITMAVAKPAFFAPVLKDHRRLMTSFFVASLHYFRQVPNNSHLIFSFQFTQVFIFFFPFVKEKGTQTKIFLKSLFGFTSVYIFSSWNEHAYGKLDLYEAKGMLQPRPEILFLLGSIFI
ncbi:uncharacterized protein LOC130741642 isoform X2 [Lotus japonicus]|uniref:uncharacterized protein LOC130741642 isoform X2 n=1 Tax=Lotus japonicus TaxID=34305 RepID=UPI0025905818|nr:uncharacterized protein LOC130741642 isoform X2 [Lotus japonicus]